MFGYSKAEVFSKNRGGKLEFLQVIPGHYSEYMKLKLCMQYTIEVRFVF